MKKLSLTCIVNGEKIEAEVEPRLLLSDFIRHELRLTATHIGCEMGVCGACTVMVDGDPVRSCLMLAAQADGTEVRTLESLGEDGKLGRLQDAFHRHHALQCGFCTAGILMTLEALEASDRMPRTEEEVRQTLSGNICRCTGYQNIVDAVLSLAQ